MEIYLYFFVFNSLLLMQGTNEASLSLNHSVNLLKKLSLPSHTAVTVNSGSHSNGSYFYMFNASAGNQMVRTVVAYCNCFLIFTSAMLTFSVFSRYFKR